MKPQSSHCLEVSSLLGVQNLDPSGLELVRKCILKQQKAGLVTFTLND